MKQIYLVVLMKNYNLYKNNDKIYINKLGDKFCIFDSFEKINKQFNYLIN